jgi:hypothetical protein
MTPQDLLDHNCVRLRLGNWDGSIMQWNFEKDGRKCEAAVDGSLVVNDWFLLLNAVLDGLGVGYCPEILVSSHLADGRLEPPSNARSLAGIRRVHAAAARHCRTRSRHPQLSLEFSPPATGERNDCGRWCADQGSRAGPAEAPRTLTPIRALASDPDVRFWG